MSKSQYTRRAFMVKRRRRRRGRDRQDRGSARRPAGSGLLFGHRPERPRPLRHHRRRNAGLWPPGQRDPAAGRRMRGGVRPLRRPPHARQGDRRTEAAHDPALPGAARQPGDRLPDRRGSRPLAQAPRRGGGPGGKGRVLREADVALRRRRHRDGGRREGDRPHRPGRLAARQLGDLHEGEGADREGRDRRPDARRGLARPQRPQRGVAVSSSAGPLPADARLGHLAERRAQAPLRREGLRALALLEGVRHGRRRRPARSPRQRHDVHARLERAAQARHGHWAGSCASRTDATCRTCTRRCSTTEGRRSTCG